MNRRTFLGFAGVATSLGMIGFANRERGDALAVRFWLSERAARYPAVARRVEELVTFALDLPFWTLEVTDGGEVSIDTEHAATATTSGEWPANLLVGALGSDVDPVPDVNLLVTDGRLDAGPSGYGVPHVASVGGARHLATLDPVEPSTGPVALTHGTFAAQVLVHEVGHALRLTHEHGAAFRRGDAVVVTPMLSAYAWDPAYDGDRSACGGRFPDAVREEGRPRRLTYRYSACARRGLRRYRRRRVP